ncbi:MAG TPA: hypothetical protein VFN51_02945 [Candidatus Saccharimonadales bacterium]|nr:hypothetical protein [Candidatus Saccharimonadales bacterium]
MKNIWQLFRQHNRISLIYLLLIVAYLYQSLVVPPNPSTLHLYHITAGHLKLLLLTIEIPYVVIWLIAFYGFLRLRDYATKIRGEKDGQGFFTLSQGLFLLVLWLPISSVMTNFFKQYYTGHPASTASLVRLQVYIDLLLLLVGFYLIYLGSQRLLKVISDTKFSASLPIILLFIAYASFYVMLALHDPSRRYPADGVAVATYYEPDWLITLTVLIPRLCYWFLGIQAVYNLFVFRNNVKGIIYKNGIKTFAIGISGTILITMLLRSLQSISTTLVKFHLNFLLIIIYLLLIVIAGAYIYVARGSVQLQKLEEL